MRMVVWERGAGPTLACGTGACATVVAGECAGDLAPTLVSSKLPASRCSFLCRCCAVLEQWWRVGRLHLWVGVAAGVLEGKVDRMCRVDLPGGPLFIEWRESDNKVFMTGPADLVFTGDLSL